MYNLVEDELARGPALPPCISSSLNSYPKETQDEVIRQLERRLGRRWLAPAVATERWRHCLGRRHIFCRRLQPGNHHSDRYSAWSCSSFFMAGRRLAV